MKVKSPEDDSKNSDFSHEERGNFPARSLEDVLAGQSSSSVFQMQTGLFHHGRNRAINSGTTEPRPEDIRALEDHARAMARDVYRDRYDPSQNAHDAMHQAEHERSLTQREDAEKTEQHAIANLRDAESNLAQAPKAGPKPAAHPLVEAAFIIVISLTVAPTLHDSIFQTLSDDLLAWFGSWVSAACVGGMLTLAILRGRRTEWTWIGLVAGVMLGIGLSAVRIAFAEGAGEVMFAIGLTIVEIAAVLLLEWLASGLRIRDAEWSVRHTAESEAVGARDAAQADLTRWQTRLRGLTETIARQIAFVEDRHNRNIHIAELEAVAIKAVLDGYNAGIAENVGRIRGVPRRGK